MWRIRHLSSSTSWDTYLHHCLEEKHSTSWICLILTNSCVYDTAINIHWGLFWHNCLPCGISPPQFFRELWTIFQWTWHVTSRFETCLCLHRWYTNIRCVQNWSFKELGGSVSPSPVRQVHVSASSSCIFRSYIG